MKNIKLILLTAAVCLSLASCGTNAGNKAESPNPTADVKSAADRAINGAGNAVNDAGNTAGDIIRDAGDTVGDAAEGVGNMAKDAANGAGDAIGVNDANGNGR